MFVDTKGGVGEFSLQEIESGLFSVLQIDEYTSLEVVRDVTRECVS